MHARPLDLDGILIGLAITLALVSGLALTRPVVPHPVGWTPPTPFAGALDFEVGEVRRRPAGSLVWYSAEPGDAVFLGDALFVAEGGVAAVRLEDGARLELEEKTLVVLEPTGKDTPAAIALQRGSLTVSSGSAPRALASGDTRAALAPGTEAVLTRGTEHDALQVRRGEATLGTGERVGSERTARVAGGTVSVIRPFSTQLHGPRPGEVLLEGRPPGFRFEGAPAGASVQVARDRRFGEPLSSDQPLSPGTYWWRVVDEAMRPASEVRRFTVLEDLPPAVVSPVDDARFGAAQVPLQWRPVEGASAYRVEVASTRDFEAPLFQTEVTASRALWSGGDDGTFYWRVRARLAGQDGHWSSPARFRVALRPLPAAPVLSAPQLEVTPARERQP